MDPTGPSMEHYCPGYRDMISYAISHFMTLTHIVAGQHSFNRADGGYSVWKHPKWSAKWSKHSYRKHKM